MQVVDNLSTEKAFLAKCGERHNLNRAISLFVIKGFEDVKQLVRSDNPLDGREVLDVSGDEVGIVSGHGNLVEYYILRIEDLIISLNSNGINSGFKKSFYSERYLFLGEFELGTTENFIVLSHYLFIVHGNEIPAEESVENLHRGRVRSFGKQG